MLSTFKKSFAALAAITGAALSPMAVADSISPTSFSATLGVGESVTITKTVVVSAGTPTSALVDVMFVFDTTGSMGDAIGGAKAAANNILTSLAGFGNLQSGVGFYNDPGSGITSNLSASTVPTVNAINALSAGGGGDFPELGFDGIRNAAAGATWRAGSSRFIIAIGDASFKNGDFTQANASAALAANGVKLIGLEYGGGSFTADINALGGTTYAGSTDASTIVDTIMAGVGSSFSTYSNVTVGDLGGGLPQIQTTAVCTGANIGTCIGANAVGTYDRSVDRTFTFDVTFTRLAAGDKTFNTYGLVDGKIVATEVDDFGGGISAPEPATLSLLGLGLLGMGISRRRKTN